jgi:hypothetical protein
MPAVEERVDRLEEAIDRFVANVGVEFNKLYNSQMRTEAELREFKEEMRLYREDTQAFKDEMRTFKDEMGSFKDEMGGFKDEMHEDRREMNRKWGDLANKLGSMVEDLVYPSLPRVIQEMVGQEPDRVAIRVKQRGPDGRRKEFDAYAVTEGLVFLNSTKATLRSADIDAFVSEIATFRDYFPEYRDLPLVGILATLSVDESVLSYAEKQGFLVLAVGDEVMEVKNRPGFEPKRW